MSAVLGLISLVAVIACVVVSYKSHGVVSERIGAALFLSVVFSVSGLIMGIHAHMDDDLLLLFPKIGIALNTLSVIACGVILYAGV
ncbi:MAG: hypothetical protein IKR58_00755 [Lachnospiraceae bacterium]|nr:hypothetical protein [Lachnospiraceae bacterium]